ncbi:MAG TPA: polysaccharide deacetylase family protein [Candidatus Paceibacterota bacterium]|nr:polysaccharide deacetylase family protein [Candidatus Paceibacterota bacterium]
MTTPKRPGTFVVSLDFELYWGMTDAATLDAYGANIRGVRTAIPRMLDLFVRYGIHATWATIGMLMARSKTELLSLLPPPERRPTYVDPRLSSYEYLKTAPVGEEESVDPYHFGSSLVERIKETPGQEIANHTFSHYYCIEGNAHLVETLGADLDAHARVSALHGVRTRSIVFPRNQVSPEALLVCAEHGITAYRGTENHFLYRPRRDEEQTLFVRALRLFDHYVDVSGYHTYPTPVRTSDLPVNVPASRFFRPWIRALSLLEPLRMRRIKNAMTHAAKRGEVFHLWWHPHNFGVNQDRNFKNLETILEHFASLRKTYGMESHSMAEVAETAA